MLVSHNWLHFRQHVLTVMVEPGTCFNIKTLVCRGGLEQLTSCISINYHGRPEGSGGARYLMCRSFRASSLVTHLLSPSFRAVCYLVANPLPGDPGRWKGKVASGGNRGAKFPSSASVCVSTLTNVFLHLLSFLASSPVCPTLNPNNEGNSSNSSEYVTW